jgi:hypothetical protein
MQDETPQNEATPQSENVETTTGETAEERCIRGGAVMDAALIAAGTLGPTLPVVAQWGKDAWDAHNEQKQEQPEIILPPGTEE